MHPERLENLKDVVPVHKERSKRGTENESDVFHSGNKKIELWL
jgi:hypothetical protein